MRLGTVARLARMRFPEGHDGDVALAVAATRAIASPAYPIDEREVRRMAERDQVSGAEVGLRLLLTLAAGYRHAALSGESGISHLGYSPSSDSFSLTHHIRRSIREYLDNTGNSRRNTLSCSKNNPFTERMWFMPSVPAPEDPGWDEDPDRPDRDPESPEEQQAWLDWVCERDGDPFYGPQEYWDPEACAPPPGQDELTAEELAGIRAADSSMLRPHPDDAARPVRCHPTSRHPLANTVPEHPCRTGSGIRLTARGGNKRG